MKKIETALRLYAAWHTERLRKRFRFLHSVSDDQLLTAILKELEANGFARSKKLRNGPRCWKLAPAYEQQIERRVLKAWKKSWSGSKQKRQHRERIYIRL